MKTMPRWLKRAIETAKADTTMMPWTRAREARRAIATNRPIRTTLRPQRG